MFLTLEDMEGQMDMILFPDVYRRAKAFIYDAAPMLVTGIVEIDTARGEPLMRVERILRIGVA
ncbi:MAG: hypothetical protein HGA86_04010 [Anaerolineaceae bacterium]|nr:hypothetical protein [Anaerolineaceae bacterium]